MAAYDEEVLVITTIAERNGDVIERGLGGAFAEAGIRAVPLSVLKTNMEQFLAQLREILAAGEERVGSFEIERVEVAAQITGAGEVCLMGTGAKLGMQGGITFVLRRDRA